MKLLEYEAKTILQKYGISIPEGKTAQTAFEAATIARELAKPVFIKSQITVSGRGKAGGILPAKDEVEAARVASKLLVSRIKGLFVNKLLIEEKLDIQEQLFASVAIDRQAKAFVMLASSSGGGDIEDVARNSPGEIVRYRIDPLSELSYPEVARMLNGLKLNEKEISKFASIMVILYKVALEYDAELVEINPLGKLTSGAFVAADARIILDDNALFRHPEFAQRSLEREEDTPREADARKQGFAYVDLDGDIGIIGNGAGLVMATVDIVQLLGGKPANFLDIGGGAQVEVIKNGVLLVMGKPEVKSCLINILGGITRCDIVANGVVEGLKATAIKKPIVVRMMGTNEKEGQDILRQNGISYYSDMEQAAQAIIRN